MAKNRTVDPKKIAELVENPARVQELVAESAVRTMERQGLQAHRAHKQLVQGGKKSKRKPAYPHDDVGPVSDALQFAQAMHSIDPNTPDEFTPPADDAKAPYVPVINDVEDQIDVPQPAPGAVHAPKQAATTVMTHRNSDTASPGYVSAPLASQDCTHPGFRMVEGETAFDQLHKGAVVVSGQGAELHFFDEDTEPTRHASERDRDKAHSSKGKKKKKK